MLRRGALLLLLLPPPLLLSLLLPAPAALALAGGELQLGAGPALGRALLPGEADNGPAALAHASLGLGQVLGLDLAVGWARHAAVDAPRQGMPAEDLAFAALALRHQLDLSGWELFLLAGAGRYQGALPPGIPFDPWGLQLGLGLHSRIWSSRWGPAVELRYHAFLADLASYPHYLTLTLRLDATLPVWSR